MDPALWPTLAPGPPAGEAGSDWHRAAELWAARGARRLPLQLCVAQRPPRGRSAAPCAATDALPPAGAGDMAHLLSIIVLLLKIRATKSCRGEWRAGQLASRSGRGAGVMYERPPGKLPPKAALQASRARRRSCMRSSLCAATWTSSIRSSLCELGAGAAGREGLPPERSGTQAAAHAGPTAGAPRLQQAVGGARAAMGSTAPIRGRLQCPLTR